MNYSNNHIILTNLKQKSTFANEFSYIFQGINIDSNHRNGLCTVFAWSEMLCNDAKTQKNCRGTLRNHFSPEKSTLGTSRNHFSPQKNTLGTFRNHFSPQKSTFGTSRNHFSPQKMTVKTFLKHN